MIRSPQSSFHFFPEFQRDSVSFSKDGQWVAYVSFPEGTLWKSKLDGSQRLQLTYPPLTPVGLSWSPDGQQIVFFAFSPGQKIEVVYRCDRWGSAARNDARRPQKSGTPTGRQTEPESSSAALHPSHTYPHPRR